MRTIWSITLVLMLCLMACQPRLGNETGEGSANKNTMEKTHLSTLKMSCDGNYGFIDRGPNGFSLMNLKLDSVLLEAADKSGFVKLFFGTNGVLHGLIENGEVLGYHNGEWRGKANLGKGETVLDVAGSDDGKHLLALLVNEHSHARILVDGQWEIALPNAAEGRLETNWDLNLLGLSQVISGKLEVQIFELNLEQKTSRVLWQSNENPLVSCGQPAIVRDRFGVLHGENLVLGDLAGNKVVTPGSARDEWQASGAFWLLSRNEEYLDDGRKRVSIRAVVPANGEVRRSIDVVLDGNEPLHFYLDPDGDLWRFWLGAEAQLTREKIPWE